MKLSTFFLVMFGLYIGMTFAAWFYGAITGCGYGCEQATDVTGPYVDPECPQHGWITRVPR